MKERLNFLCVGFQKSGTTTLDAILRQHSQIELPLIIDKETQYFHWNYRYDDSIKIFWSRFFCARGIGIRGAIEPEFDFFAEGVRKNFGRNVKLIFIMRNPVERLYSFFRMELKLGDKLIQPYYSKRCRVSDMYEKFLANHIIDTENNINPYIERGKYMKCIRNFLNFYPEENMKFIIFEDFIQNPEKVIKDIQDFLGVDYEELNCDIIENKGNRVSRNYSCLLVNHMITKFEFFLRCNAKIPVSIFNKIQPFLEKIRYYLTIDIKDKMSKKARKICEDFYRKDKQELECFLHRDLSQIWYE